MTNTISMLTIFVTVLITNCQVSLQWKIGPVTSQTKVIKQMATNAELEPASFAVFCAMLANPCFLVTIIHPTGSGISRHGASVCSKEQRRRPLSASIAPELLWG